MHVELKIKARTFDGAIFVCSRFDHVILDLNCFFRRFVGRSSDDSRVFLSQPSYFGLLRLVVCVLGDEKDGVFLVALSSRLSVDLVAESLFM